MKRENPLKVSVLGGGAFGTILAHISASCDNETILWLRDTRLAEQIRVSRFNKKYAAHLRLADNIKITTRLSLAANEADLILLALPSKAFHHILLQLLPHITSQHYLVSTTKGLEPHRFRTMSEIMNEEMTARGFKPSKQTGVLSGPNLADELGNKHISGTVIASHNPQLRSLVRQAIGTKYFHIFESAHIYGVELGGVLKNIYAIAAGIADALGFGMNTKSVLITRSLMEMTHFARQLKVDPITFVGLAGIGDLIVTCSSSHSRNYRFGQALAKGIDINKINKQLGGVAEGVHTARLVYEKAQELSVSMPLLEAIYKIVCQGERVKHVLWKTLRNTPKEDVEYPNEESRS